ncbi:MAG: hypothetical protein M1115_07395 [Actinobacteria bacterium]|nr:hypothetical protein [Actinomycetota bacterium]
MVVVNTLGYVRDPVAFLAGCGDVLSEDGYVVVSVPNVAYAGVQMDLLEGRLPYGQCGGRELPARFFDRASLLTTVERAGLCRLSETTTLGHPLNASSSRPPSVLGARVAAALADHPESSVEHFVLTLARPGCKLSEPPPMLPLAHLHARFRALRQDQERIAAWADGEVSTIREESAERERSFKEMAAKLSGLESRLAQVAAQFELELQARLASAFEETESVRKDLDALRNELSAVYATKTFRYTTSLRKLYAALRSHGSSR